MEISAIKKHEQFKIFINGLLHLHIKTTPLIGFQSWIYSAEHYIEYTFADGTKLRTSYSQRETWEKILILLEEHLGVI